MYSEQDWLRAFWPGLQYFALNSGLSQLAGSGWSSEKVRRVAERPRGSAAEGLLPGTAGRLELQSGLGALHSAPAGTSAQPLQSSDTSQYRNTPVTSLVTTTRRFCALTSTMVNALPCVYNIGVCCIVKLHCANGLFMLCTSSLE